MENLSLLQTELPPWYAAHRRKLPWREDREPYHVWLSEIMLQQTRVEAVIGYYRRFLEALPTIGALADTDDEKLLKLWEGLGYYSRARNLKKAARQIMERHGGRFPETYEEILALPGIGLYTAGAVASICFGLPHPAVDGNVTRVYARFTEYPLPADTDAAKKQIAGALTPLYAEADCGALTQSLMELGACVCVPNGAPKCGLCPVKDGCAACRNESWERFPVRSAKRPRKTAEKIVLVLHCGERFAVKKRPAKGLLAGLWEFPNADAADENEITPDAAAALAAACGAKPLRLERQIAYTHVFTHVEWRMTAFFFACEAMPADFCWVTAEDLEKDYALPSAFRPFLEATAQPPSA